jgi:hypothetical protein
MIVYCESLSCSATVEAPQGVIGDVLAAEGWVLDDAGAPWCDWCVNDLVDDG